MASGTRFDLTTDTLAQSDLLNEQAVTPTVTEALRSSVIGEAQRLSEAIWQPARPLLNARLTVGAATAVAQNGRTGLDHTGGIAHHLGAAPRRLPPLDLRRERFVTLAKWTGRVRWVDADSFVAIVQDQLKDVPEEEVELPQDEVAPADRPLLAPGAVFYWMIGYRDRVDGQRTRESVIHFRRLPTLSPDELVEAQESARRIQALMDDG